MTDALAARLSAALEGRYRIERELGEGGMATVYLAEDLKHDRKVAIKVLRPELAAVIGAERFLAEIKTTANLQHPHILPLFDSGEADSFLYYVMPYVEGETLRDRLDREGQLPVEEAVRIAREVADALDYAHRKDVIHRDIKPANILLHDGRPVVSDFGIALAISAAGGGRMTETGLSLGTPHYMSPEQASADRDLSPRSDVYALGCVLYEMLAGQPPHTGPSAQSVLVRILTEDPRPLTELRRTVPPHVAAAVTKAIEKLPADRFESARAFMDALEDSGFTHTVTPRAAVPGSAALPTSAALSASPWGRRLPWALVAVLGLALAASLLRPGGPGDAPTPVPFRTQLTGFDGTLGSNFTSSLAVSPDGTLFAVAGGEMSPDGWRILIRGAADTEFRILAGTEGADGSPSFSPDGQWLAFTTQDEEIRKVSVAGGPPISLATGALVHWGTPDTLVYDGPGGIFAVSASGGTPTLLVPDSVAAAWVSLPHLLPDGEGLLFVGFDDQSIHRLMLKDLVSGEITEVGSGGRGFYVPTGHIVYGVEGTLMAVPFDLDSKRIQGDAVPVLARVTVSGGFGTQLDFSRTGTLIYAASDEPIPGGEEAGRLVWVDLEGNRTPTRIRQENARVPRVSPDGRRIAYASGVHVWVYDVETGENTQVTSSGTNDDPIWSGDGRLLYFSSEREGTLGADGFRKVWNGDQPAEQLWRREGDQVTVSASPDGSWLVVGEVVEGRGRDLLVADLRADSLVLESYLRADWGEYEGTISPNGRWMAYTSDEAGREEVFVRGFPEPLGQVQVSSQGAYDPAWSPDGRALYFRAHDGTLTRADVDPDGARFSVSAVTSLFDWPYASAGGQSIGYGVHPDGTRFVAKPNLVRGDFGEVHVVVNWFEELRARVGEARR